MVRLFGEEHPDRTPYGEEHQRVLCPSPILPVDKEDTKDRPEDDLVKNGTFGYQ